MVVAGAWETLEQVVVELKRAQIAALPPEQRQALGDPEALAQAVAAQELAVLCSAWYREFLVYDPTQDWARIRVPVLALFGAPDVQVDAYQNKAALQGALARAGNPDLTVIVLPQANHLFQPAETGDLEEYGLLGPNLVPELLPTVSHWIFHRMQPARRQENRCTPAAPATGI